MNKKDFVKGVEKLIDPINVGTLHFMQFFNALLPRKIQNQLVTESSKKTPYMGFVVEPYSSFLCYEIKDVEYAKSLLPNNFELVKTKIFEDDEPKYYSIFGCINSHTSAFWGLRVEFYVIAEDKKTGLLSWIIIDYDTNTISHDKKNGLSKPNSGGSVITTTCSGELIVDICREDKSRRLSYDYDVKKGIRKNLDQRLWLEGNLSIGYGKIMSENNADIFSLKFMPCEVESALMISDINIDVNSWYPGLFEEKPSVVVCFPYAQHFISDSPGHASNLKNEKELIESVEALNFSNIKVFSTKSFGLMFLIGGFVSFVITITLLILLMLK